MLIYVVCFQYNAHCINKIGTFFFFNSWNAFNLVNSVEHFVGYQTHVTARVLSFDWLRPSILLGFSLLIGCPSPLLPLFHCIHSSICCQMRNNAIVRFVCTQCGNDVNPYSISIEQEWNKWINEFKWINQLTSQNY